VLAACKGTPRRDSTHHQTAPVREHQGRFTELAIDGNNADVRVVKDGLTGAIGVTLVGDSALVLVERAKAVVLPYCRH
jgi:hypothetical protein